VRRPSVHSRRTMGSADDCGKGYSPKLKRSSYSRSWFCYWI